MRQIIQKNFRALFLILVATLYLLVFFFNRLTFSAALNFSLFIFRQITFALILVFIFTFLTNLFLNPEKIKSYLGEKSGIKGIFIVLFGGIISTGPIYAWYPLLQSLKGKGMRPGLIAIFLYNRAIKIPLLPIMIYYFGWQLVLILTLVMIFASIIIGILIEKLV